MLISSIHFLLHVLIHFLSPLWPQRKRDGNYEMQYGLIAICHTSMTILTSISTSLLKMNINFCQFSFLLKIVIFSIQRPMISFRKPTLFLLVTSGSSEELRPSMSWILSKIDHILRIENNHSTLIYVKKFFFKLYLYAYTPFNYVEGDADCGFIY